MASQEGRLSVSTKCSELSFTLTLNAAYAVDGAEEETHQRSRSFVTSREVLPSRSATTLIQRPPGRRYRVTV